MTYLTPVISYFSVKKTENYWQRARINGRSAAGKTIQ
tara:strand:+ start:3946 stop:4056 length:111 start_codon:yes stop_codon:yes gene_type:complete